MFNKFIYSLCIGCIVFTAGQAYRLFEIDPTQPEARIAKNLPYSCGFKDPENLKLQDHSRIRRYIHNPDRIKWNKKGLTYRIYQYSSTAPKSVVNKETRRAFSDWSQYIPLNMKQVYMGQADIEITFEKLDPNSPVLGYAAKKGKGAKIGVNDNIDWVKERVELSVLLRHEIGHVLGLAHAKNVPVGKSIMWHGKSIMQDDIDAVQSLYGKRIRNEKPSS